MNPHTATHEWRDTQILQITEEGIQLDEVEDGRGYKIHDTVNRGQPKSHNGEGG